MTLPYNAFLLFLDMAVLAAFRRITRWRYRVLCLAATGVVAVLAGAVLGEDGFGQMRLWAYGLFGHGVLLLAGVAILSARAGRRTAVLCGVGAVLIAGVGVYAFLIEPTWLEVTRYRIESAKLDRPIRIVVIADIQTDRIGAYERRVLEQAAEEKPDVVLFLGDYLQVRGREERRRLSEEFRAAFREAGLRARLGMFAVKGNVDGWGWAEFFEGLPVRTFEETTSVEVAGVRLTGLGGAASLRARTSVRPTDGFHIVFGHHPDFALGRVRADLLLAGHTHGGQVRLPFWGPLTKRTRVPRRWTAGATDVGRGRTLIVSRGIGMERYYAPRLRFLCRPELVVIDLVPRG